MRVGHVVASGFALAVLLTAALPATAAPGDVDPTFGDGGIVVEEQAADRRDATDGALTSDGKVVIVGAEGSGQDRDVRILRLNADGSPDGSFGDDGVVTRNFLEDEGRGVVAQPDGKIVVVGESWVDLPAPPPVNPAQPTVRVRLATIMRFEADGDRDPSFGYSNGIAWAFPGQGGPVNTNTIDATFYDVARQPDGKLVAAGWRTLADSVVQPFLVRFTASGEPDVSFGDDGVTVLDTPVSVSARAVAVQPGGSIVVSLLTYTSEGSRVELRRVSATGEVDTTFGQTGAVTFPGNGADPAGLVVEPDGTIVAAAFDREGPDRLLLARLDADGAFDETFGDGGLTATSYGDSQVTAIAVDETGRIIAAGASTQRGFGARRFLADGTLDETFGDAGEVSLLDNAAAYHVDLQLTARSCSPGSPPSPAGGTRSPQPGSRGSRVRPSSSAPVSR